MLWGEKLALDYLCLVLLQRSRGQLVATPHPAWFGTSAPLRTNHILEECLQGDAVAVGTHQRTPEAEAPSVSSTRARADVHSEQKRPGIKVS